MRSRDLATVGAVLLLASPACAGGLPLLTRVEQIRRLTPDRARLGYPVHVRGMVTYRDPFSTAFYFQDATAGIYVECKEKGNRIKPGQAVEVRGYSSPGQFAPNIRDPQVRILGKGRWPAVKPSTFEELSSGSKAAQWVEIRGIVQWASLNKRSQLELRVAAGPGRFQTIIHQHSVRDPSRLVDAIVRLRGVCATNFTSRRQFTGFRLRIPSMADVAVEEPAPEDPYAVAATPIQQLLQFSAEIRPGRRVKVQGVVTLHKPGRSLFIRGASQALNIQTQQETPVEPGDMVDVLGFASVGDYTPVLHYAIFRKTGSGPPPAAAPVTAAEAVRGSCDADLVRIEGVLLDRIRQNQAQILVLQQGNIVFNAELEESRSAGDRLAHLRERSRLQLTGVCSAQVDENRVPRAFRIYLRGAEDVTVLERPSWWTLARLAWVLAVMTAVVLAAALWVSVLRRRVRRQTEIIRQKLERESILEERYRDLFENANDIIYTRDLAGHVTSMNPAAERITGYSREEGLGRSILELVAPERKEQVREWIERMNTGGELTNREVEIIRKDGQRRTLEFSSRTIYRDGRPVRVDTIGRDITDRKRTELELQRAKEAAEAASRAKSEFLANVSHEIRTPMNGVIGMAALALATELSPEQREYLGTIKSCAESLLGVINDILDFSKIEAGKLELDPAEFRLRRTLAEVVGAVAARARAKGLHLAWQVDAGLPDLLFADAGRLRQVILNLLGNGVKFTPSGEVVLDVGCERADSAACTLHFSVRDTGIGIPAEKQKVIFEAFAQADGSMRRQYGGTGLGLAISSKLVALMGGRIWVESEPGKGSTFHFTAEFGLPQGTAAEPGAEDAAPARRPVPDHLAILLVEDNPVNQKVAARMLESRGHKVELAATGREALAAMERARFDLVLMDVQMPEMDGFEATAAIRERERGTGRRVPIIALTAHAMKGDRERCLEAGMDGYVSKPVRAEELLTAIGIVMSEEAGHVKPVAC